MTRSADKGTALDALRTEVGAAACVYVGDDAPDEDAFARLNGNDLSVKVGDGDTIASRRLADPHAVRSSARRAGHRLDRSTDGRR